MKVTASNIISWVENNNKIAQQELPKIIRRLCFHASDTKAISFPAGDSTFMPSWDGILESVEGNAWIPSDKSVWEIGTDSSVGSKANSDFKKRTTDSSKEFKADHTYVFITPRRWKGKSKWITENKNEGGWKEVRAYDATDLEEWIDSEPANAVYIAETLGISGHGVKSAEAYFNDWVNQCEPALTREALTFGRESSFELLKNTLIEYLSKNNYSVVSVYSDSVEESVINAIVAIMDNNQLFSNSVVITDVQGWQYVQNNPEIKIVICASPEIAQHPSINNDLTIIVPESSGNKSTSGNDLVIDRASYYDFEKALVFLGEEESDAQRLSKQVGRSWTVYRRVKAINSAIQKPEWTTQGELALTLLSLVGSWDGRNDKDREFTSNLAETEYDDIESELLKLASLDDSPVIKIDQIWKIKSPVEVLPSISSSLTDEIVDRYFIMLKNLFSIIHPKLELASDQRYMASIHGKQFPYSNVLLNGVTNSLVKLAVIGDDFTDSSTYDFTFKAGCLIKDILLNSSLDNWITLEEHFKYFAEANPEAFLDVLENDLKQEKPLLQGLFKESTSGLMTAQRYFDHLLWSLELLAWNPRYLTRVCHILIELDKFIVPSNYTNTPFNSLYSIFRPWYPQTNATVNQRIQVLERIITIDEETAFKIFLKQSDLRVGHAIPNAKPIWRNDNAGHNVSNFDRQKAIEFAIDKMTLLAKSNPKRIMSILDLYHFKYFDLWERVVYLLERLARSNISDEVRIDFRNKLRRYRKHYPNTGLDDEYIDLQLGELIHLFKPKSLIHEHLWLFERSMLYNLLERGNHNYNEVIKLGDKKRAEAVSVIFQSLGIDGLLELLKKAKDKVLCCSAIVASNLIEVADLINYIKQDPRFYNLESLKGIVWAQGDEEAINNLRLITQNADLISELDQTVLVDLLLALPSCKDIWNIAKELNLENDYWRRFNNLLGSIDNPDDKIYCIESLIEANRPVALIESISSDFKNIDPNNLLDYLELLTIKPERQISHHSLLKEIIGYLEEQDNTDEFKLLGVEYQLFPLFDHGSEASLKTLYRTLMNNPNIFIKLLKNLYLPDPKEQIEQKESKALLAHEILNGCKVLPSTDKNMDFNEPDFKAFIKEVRNQSEQLGILNACDEVIGQILSHSPHEDNEKSILTMVADVLNLPDGKNLRRGFDIGSFNQRGAHYRDIGGTQERALADKYRKYAKPWMISHPYVAQMFEDMARSYENQAKREDISQKLDDEYLR